MGDVLLVHVLQSLQNLLDVVGHDALRQLVLVDDARKELAATATALGVKDGTYSGSACYLAVNYLESSLTGPILKIL